MGGKTYINFYGDKELIKKLDSIGANVEKVCAEALTLSVQKPKQEMLDFISQHRKTGITESSFEEEIKVEDGVITAVVGFQPPKGLPALFLNLGTPTIEPTFFVDKAVENNLDEIRNIQLKYISEMFKGV